MANATCIKSFSTRIAGITFYNDGIDGTYRQSILEDLKNQGRLNIGQRLYLKSEPENRFDCHAVQVLAPDGRQLGYVPRTESQEISGLLANGAGYVVTISDIRGGSSGIGYRLGINIDFFETDMEGGATNHKKENEIQKVLVENVQIKGLFGIFDYSLDFNNDMTMIHAMNGAGKSTILRMLTGVINCDFNCFTSIPCAAFIVLLSNKTKISFCSSAEEPGEQHIDHVSFKYPKSFLIPSDIEYDRNTVICLDDPVASKMIRHCTGGLRVKLVSANRLYDLSDDIAHGKERVVTCAAMIEEKVKNAKELFAQYSETLDSSFLYRVMEDIQYRKNYLPYTDCNQRRANLERQRDEFALFGLQNKYEGHTANPSYDVDENTSIDVLHMMTTFIRDSETKNQTIIEVYRKISLLLRMINEEHEFCKKKLFINFGENPPIQIRNNNNQIVPLVRLSSGEKHDFILFSELIFECNANTLVLIDEPEISLHPAWQMLMINELMEIGQMNHFQIIVATHSPNIVNDHWDKTVALEEQ